MLVLLYWHSDCTFVIKAAFLGIRQPRKAGVSGHSLRNRLRCKMKTGIFSKDEAYAAFIGIIIFAFCPGDFCVQSHDLFSYRTFNFKNSCRAKGSRIGISATFFDTGGRRKYLQGFHWSSRTGELMKGGANQEIKPAFYTV